MRVLIVALALFTAGCAALPPEIRIRFPDWMRGQGVTRPADTAVTAPAAATPTPPAATTTGFTLPSGAFPTVHQTFTAQVAQRFSAGQNQAAIVSSLREEGFSCTPDAAGQQVCERLQPIGQGCEDVFVVTARSGGGAVGDVRRRCPLGVTAPTGAPLG